MNLQSLKQYWPSSFDSIGEGPPKGRLGRKVFYQVDDLVRWMESRLETEA